ncbi:MAG: GatB/YqeY domain-containing protein [Cyclobacteriaceae bacterium]|nr:GatB/YqeY domain-containing protein [Cyclobacteriaceae bacterium]
MSLKQTIEEDLKNAMKAKDKDALRALRAVKSLILLAETEKGGSETLTEDTEIKLLQKAVKQRNDSIAIFREQGRNDLADAEQVEVDIISRYLPKALSPEELETEIKNIIEQVQAVSIKDMGKVMGAASASLGGKADGKSISEVVKRLLNQA